MTAQLRCTRCGEVPRPPATVLVAQYGEQQEKICSKCFVTEDASSPWDYMLEIDVRTDGSLWICFPAQEDSS